MVETTTFPLSFAGSVRLDAARLGHNYSPAVETQISGNSAMRSINGRAPIAFDFLRNVVAEHFSIQRSTVASLSFGHGNATTPACISTI